MNPNYEDQTYAAGRSLDRQDGRLSGGLKHEPIFLRPTQAEFWILLLVSAGTTLLILVTYAILATPDTGRLVLGGVALTAIAFAGCYLVEGFIRWRRTNYRYEMPR